MAVIIIVISNSSFAQLTCRCISVGIITIFDLKIILVVKSGFIPKWTNVVVLCYRLRIGVT
jgi:hypothetical protein